MVQQWARSVSPLRLVLNKVKPQSFGTEHRFLVGLVDCLNDPTRCPHDGEQAYSQLVTARELHGYSTLQKAILARWGRLFTSQAGEAGPSGWRAELRKLLPS
jgi:hypothetical protein